MLEISVENIKCEGCANSIQRELILIPKTCKIEVDATQGIVKITGNPDRQCVVNELTRLGYPEKGNNNLVHKAKSYVSCAIGRLT